MRLPSTARRAALLALVLVASPAFAAERSDEIRRDFRLSASGGSRLLVVDNVLGAVTVRAGSPGDAIRVVIRREASARRADRLDLAFTEVELAVEETTGRLELIQDGPFRCHEGRRGRWGRNCDWNPDYDLVWNWEIEVPADLDVEIGTVNDGDVQIDGVRGHVTAQNVNGAVALEGLAGELEAQTVNGPITAAWASAPTAPASLQTVNGEIEIRVPEGSGFEVSFDTLNGDLWSDLEVAAAPTRATASRGRSGSYKLGRDSAVRVGAGGPRFDCQTVNGDILLRAR